MASPSFPSKSLVLHNFTLPDELKWNTDGQSSGGHTPRRRNTTVKSPLSRPSGSSSGAASPLGHSTPPPANSSEDLSKGKDSIDGDQQAAKKSKAEKEVGAEKSKSLLSRPSGSSAASPLSHSTPPPGYSSEALSKGKESTDHGEQQAATKLKAEKENGTEKNNSLLSRPSGSSSGAPSSLSHSTPPPGNSSEALCKGKESTDGEQQAPKKWKAEKEVGTEKNKSLFSRPSGSSSGAASPLNHSTPPPVNSSEALSKGKGSPDGEQQAPKKWKAEKEVGTDKKKAPLSRPSGSSSGASSPLSLSTPPPGNSSEALSKGKESTDGEQQAPKKLKTEKKVGTEKKKAPLSKPSGSSYAVSSPLSHSTPPPANSSEALSKRKDPTDGEQQSATKLKAEKEAGKKKKAPLGKPSGSSSGSASPLSRSMAAPEEALSKGKYPTDGEQQSAKKLKVPEKEVDTEKKKSPFVIKLPWKILPTTATATTAATTNTTTTTNKSTTIIIKNKNTTTHNKIKEQNPQRTPQIKIKEQNPQQTPQKIEIKGDNNEAQDEDKNNTIIFDEEAKIWNLRPRKPLNKSKNAIEIAEKVKAPEKDKPQSPPAKSGEKEGTSGGSGEKKQKKKPSITIALTKWEIEEDIYALTGGKPARRPKKRNKNVQKQLDVLFPGLGLEYH